MAVTRKIRKNTTKNSPAVRAVWRGTIAFGLVTIPVRLASTEQEPRIRFRLLDKRDHSPVGYHQVNKITGEEIPRDQVVRGFEHKKNSFVLLNDSDFKKANVKATSTIEIEDFVELTDVDPMLFEKPYYVIPFAGGEKSYVLLREVLRSTKKAAIAKIVLHTVQRLVALIARGEYIVLETLRFADEVREVHEARFLDPEVRKLRVPSKELKVAARLVARMSSEWRPQKYKNTYRHDLMNMIQEKISRGSHPRETERLAPPVELFPKPNNVVDLTTLLQRSLASTEKKRKEKRPALRVVD